MFTPHESILFFLGPPHPYPSHAYPTWLIHTDNSLNWGNSPQILDLGGNPSAPKRWDARSCNLLRLQGRHSLAPRKPSLEPQKRRMGIGRQVCAFLPLSWVGVQSLHSVPKASKSLKRIKTTAVNWLPLNGEEYLSKNNSILSGVLSNSQLQAPESCLGIRQPSPPLELGAGGSREEGGKECEGGRVRDETSEQAKHRPRKIHVLPRTSECDLIRQGFVAIYYLLLECCSH